MIHPWKVVLIKEWPGPMTRARRSDRFGERGRGVDWTGTVRLLTRELGHLEAKDVLLQMAYTERDKRKDGSIRADAKPQHPGVILTFFSRTAGMPLTYPCDTFNDWQANVRAIALALEALRKVDRYGVTKRGEQYRGFAALPPAGGSTVTMSTGEAAALLVDFENLDGDVDAVLEDVGAFKATYRNAVKNAHPDAEGGSTQKWYQLDEARKVLEAHHGVKP